MKRGQVTMFIIIGIIIVAVGLLIYFLVINPIKPPTPTDTPNAFISGCIESSVEETIEIMLPQGGWVNPINYKEYLDDKIAYLCYAERNYKECVMQKPMYIKFLKSEIKNNIASEISLCYDSLKSEFERKNYDVSLANEMDVSVELVENSLNIKIERELVLSRNGKVESYSNIESKLPTKIYNLAIVALQIANDESQFCNSEYNGYMLLHPDIQIEKTATSDDVKIYYIKDKNTKEELKIAIKSCTLPPGF